MSSPNMPIGPGGGAGVAVATAEGDRGCSCVLMDLAAWAPVISGEKATARLAVAIKKRLFGLIVVRPLGARREGDCAKKKPLPDIHRDETRWISEQRRCCFARHWACRYWVGATLMPSTVNQYLIEINIFTLLPKP